MGRKSKRKHHPDPEDVAKADRKELNSLCTQLLEVCSRPTPMTPSKQWEEYLVIHSILVKICKKQQDNTFKNHKRDEHWDAFDAWAKEHGVSALDDTVAIHNFENTGYGLKALKEIKADEVFLSVGRKLMITETNAKESELAPLMKKDRVLQGMPHVALALFLLSEKVSGDESFWKPYIDILPTIYTLPLYFTPDELQQLQPSPVYSEAMKQHKNIARQFAYFYKMFQGSLDATKLVLKDKFTYEGYRWAVASVMSRQNQIPSIDGSHPISALIPVWDMCNHTNGKITTGYNMPDDSCESVSLLDFQPDDQILIFYGLRPNAMHLLYSGFVFPESHCDSMAIQLGISKNDKLYLMKQQMLGRMGLTDSSHSFPLMAAEFPVSAELLAFLRVFSMNEEELQKRLFDTNFSDSLSDLIHPECIVSKENEIRCWSFLETRLSLLFRQYKTPMEEAEKMLDDASLTTHTKLCTQLKLTEQRILQNAILFCQSQKERAQELEDNATSYLGDDLDGAVDGDDIDLCGHQARLLKPRGPVALATEEDMHLDDDDLDDDIPTTSSTSLSTSTGRDTLSITEISDEGQTEAEEKSEKPEANEKDTSEHLGEADSKELPNGDFGTGGNESNDVKVNGVSNDAELDQNSVSDVSSKLKELHVETENQRVPTSRNGIAEQNGMAEEE